MNDDRSLRVLHDAERFVHGTLAVPTTDNERCGWIEVLFQACAPSKTTGRTLPALRGFDLVMRYRLISRLFQKCQREKVAQRPTHGQKKHAWPRSG